MVRKTVTSNSDFLKYSKTPAARATINDHYRRWRSEHSLPERCDEEKCRYHESRLMWNGQKLPTILDHINGNRWDNRPENLRLLCPNCDSQLKTRGGSNRGRVRELFTEGYLLRSSDNQADYSVFLEDRLEVKDMFQSSLSLAQPQDEEDVAVRQSTEDEEVREGIA